MEFALRLELPEALVRELNHAAHECRVTPESFLAQSIECVLASRRLPSITVGRCGPRMRGESPKAQSPIEHAAGPDTLSPVDIPTVDDLGSLDDIT